MNIFEKFYTDTQKIIHKHNDTEYPPLLCRLLCTALTAYNAQLKPLADDMCVYWQNTHSADTREAAAQWFYKIFCFFADGFEPTMDFSRDDWQEIAMSIDSSAEDIDMATIQSCMRILVERGKLS